MAKILILGGGFGGVIAAERLMAGLGNEHQVTLVSRSRRFVFYPALVRLAFGKCEPEELSFDLRQSMLDHRVNFIEAEVARVVPEEKIVVTAHGEVAGHLNYDYLIYSLGRRLATERITGFYEYSHHLLGIEETLDFRNALTEFQEGTAIIGQCPGARLPVPVYETAFALARLLEEKDVRDRTRITIASPDPPGQHFGDPEIDDALRKALAAHRIDYLPDFPIETITPGAVFASNGRSLNFRLLMLLPPFKGSSASAYVGITGEDGYINVDAAMRVKGLKSTYAVGDCVNFSGPKMGHMAVRQAEVAAANLLAEIEGREPVAQYVHEMRFVIDEGGSDTLYVKKEMDGSKPANVKQGLFWSWAKRVQEKYWETSHS
jgi:sulfide:quinone oxidoreductase